MKGVGCRVWRVRWLGGTLGRSLDRSRSHRPGAAHRPTRLVWGVVLARERQQVTSPSTSKKRQQVTSSCRETTGYESWGRQATTASDGWSSQARKVLSLSLTHTHTLSLSLAHTHRHRHRHTYFLSHTCTKEKSSSGCGPSSHAPESWSLGSGKRERREREAGERRERDKRLRVFGPPSSPIQ